MKIFHKHYVCWLSLSASISDQTIHLLRVQWLFFYAISHLFFFFSLFSILFSLWRRRDSRLQGSKTVWQFLYLSISFLSLFSILCIYFNASTLFLIFIFFFFPQLSTIIYSNRFPCLKIFFSLSSFNFFVPLFIHSRIILHSFLVCIYLSKSLMLLTTSSFDC